MWKFKNMEKKTRRFQPMSNRSSREIKKRQYWRGVFENFLELIKSHKIQYA